MILREERVGGRARVTTDEEQVLPGGWREKRTDSVHSDLDSL